MQVKLLDACLARFMLDDGYRTIHRHTSEVAIRIQRHDRLRVFY